MAIERDLLSAVLVCGYMPQASPHSGKPLISDVSHTRNRMGPIALFDKSFLQSLNIDEAVWFDQFFIANISPLFYVETLADLDKEIRHGRTAEDVVGGVKGVGAINKEKGSYTYIFSARIMTPILRHRRGLSSFVLAEGPVELGFVGPQHATRALKVH